MFYFRLNKIRIVNNYVNTLFKSRDKADVQLISFITTGDEPLPNLNNFNLLNETEKNLAIEEAVRYVLSSRIFSTIENIKDNQTIYFGDTGIVLFKTENIPDDFNWNLVVVGCKKRLRDTAKMIEDIFNDDSFNSFKTNLLTVLSKATNPIYTAGSEIAIYATSVILKLYSKKKDDQLGIVYQSWNRREHYNHGIRDKADQSDATGNMYYDYSMFGYADNAIAENAIRE